MYRMIVVDDEAIALRGLVSLVSWRELGFEVVGQFERGEDALAYLGSTEVDVILTDIRMGSVSGLDIARSTRWAERPPKVVLISAFREFEYATQAIELRVAHYLLKPLSIPRIVGVFRKLKSELDAESSTAQESPQRLSVERFSHEYEELLVDDILNGAVRSLDGLSRRLALSERAAPAEDDMALVVHLALEEPSHGEEIGEAGGDEAREQLRDELGSVTGATTVLLSHVGTRHFSAVCIRPSESGRHLRSADVIAGLGRFGVHGVELDGPFAVERLIRYAGAHPTVDSTRMPDGRDTLGGYLEAFREQGKRLLTHMLRGTEEECRTTLENILEAGASLPLPTLKNLVLELFSMLNTRMRESGIDTYALPGCSFYYGDLLGLRTREELEEFTMSVLANLVHETNAIAGPATRTVVERVRRFVQEQMPEDVTLERAADFAYLSPAYLSRLFRAETGQTFISFVQHERIELAKELLTRTDLRVYEICDRIGYRDLKHFHRLFRKHAGCSPNEYRDSVSSAGPGRHAEA